MKPKTPEQNARDQWARGLKPGDVTRIRTWDDMEAEYGLNNFGEIPCKAVFALGMKPLCGQTFAVERVPDDTIIGYASTGAGNRSWAITIDMVEPLPAPVMRINLRTWTPPDQPKPAPDPLTTVKREPWHRPQDKWEVTNHDGCRCAADGDIAPKPTGRGGWQCTGGWIRQPASTPLGTPWDRTGAPPPPRKILG
jgi:hypothetical protein